MILNFPPVNAATLLLNVVAPPKIVSNDTGQLVAICHSMEGNTPVDAVCFPAPLDRQAVKTVAVVTTVADAMAVFKNLFRFTCQSPHNA